MRSTILVLCAVWLVLYWLDSVCGTATAGPYDIKVQSVGSCPKKLNGKETLTFSSKLQRLSRNKLIVNINATFSIPLSDDIKIRVNLAKKTSQGFKDNYFILDLPKACSTMFTLLPDFHAILANEYKVSGCPIPPGNYSAPVDLDVGSISALLPVMEYGKVRARAFYQLAGDTLMCIEALVEYVPKKKNG